MSRMGPATVAALRRAATDPATIGRYWSHVQTSGLHDCWHWTGAISGRGHGRFQLGDDHDVTGKRRTFVIIAHRFGFALAHGVDALLATPVVAHSCDNPLCQQPTHWRPGDARSNRREWAARRREAGPLVDQRGARGRARALRDAILSGADAEAIATAGLPSLYRDQLSLLPGLHRSYSHHPATKTPLSFDDSGSAVTGDVLDQPSLFD